MTPGQLCFWNPHRARTTRLERWLGGAFWMLVLIVLAAGLEGCWAVLEGVLGE